MKLIIGLTGSVGSGCTTLSRGLESEGFSQVSISKLIKDKFRKLHEGKEPNLESFGEDWRAELQEIGNRGRSGEFDSREGSDADIRDYRDYWVNLALQGVMAEKVVIDGIRNIGEVQSLRRRHAQFWLVAVYADYATQWKRVKEMGSYPNEDVFKRDNDRDSGEEEPFGQTVQRCVYEADYVLKNMNEIKPPSKVEKSVVKKLMLDLPGFTGNGEFRKPLAAEVHMATAVSQSNASQCLKRKVGALIVDGENNIPISVGYNDNPIGMESCLSIFNGQCYKDMVMETRLEEMGPFICPDCGTKQTKAARPWKCSGMKENGKPCRCNFKRKFFPSRNMELCTAIHAEERAIRSLGQRSANGCTIYVNTFPCLQCARYIKDAGISKVVYIEAYPMEEAVEFLKMNKIAIEPFEGFKPRRLNQVFRQVE